MKRKKPGAKDLPPAPGELRLLQAFLNTLDREAGSDELASPRALAAWLAGRGLLAPGTELGPADLERTVGIRQGWRSLLAGSEDAPETFEALDRATEAAALRARHGPGGLVRLEPSAGGLDGALGRMLVIAQSAQGEGLWKRLKVCGSPTCRAVFYDYSTNRSARWCRPRCGNRLSARASKRRYRRLARQREEAQRRARPQVRHKVPTLAEMEAHPELKDLARFARKIEKRRG